EDLATRLEAYDGPVEGEALQTLIFAVGTEHQFEPLRDWFKAIYEVLLGQSQGPRFGSFAALYGVKETAKLIRDGLAGKGGWVARRYVIIVVVRAGPYGFLPSRSGLRRALSRIQDDFALAKNRWAQGGWSKDDAGEFLNRLHQDAMMGAKSLKEPAQRK